MKRDLRLRREALLDLTPADLAAVRGGDYTVGDHCGPPFDTTWLPTIADTTWLGQTDQTKTTL